MKLQFIGTGSILSERMSASALVDGRLLIDTPNGSMKAMRRSGVDPGTVDLCLITHFHADHFFDAVFLLLEQGLRRSRDEDLVLIGPSGFEERLERLFEEAYPGVLDGLRDKVRPRFVEFDPSGGGECTEGGYGIEALPMEHTVPTMGYRITAADGARLGYTGDTVRCPSVDRLVSECPVVVLDTSFPREGRFGHMGLEDVEAIAERWPEAALMTTHRDDDVVRAEHANIVFPADGEVFEVTPQGLQGEVGSLPGQREPGRTSVLGVDL
ncbi:MBL fold metallo-hydrolase [Nocardiopsis suaedae]|uniref:MBL fold metallo-hydrolase n=1 Tax=Nocardiopsis suaedae TaxID=3018444 RepID=A0ABT4TM41_9ACTN|nr:MBL fold metallo-hydrolase [Nocardiopsis suaedae]MDA2805763.1 MBL fold metallo-hydrolase [Nocardiopsis suaedae]